MTYRPGRSIELWLLAFGLLAISLTGWLRLQFVLGAWDFLRETGVEPGPLYQAILGGVWGACGLVCAAGLLLRRRWAPAVTRLSVLVLVGWYWIDFLLLTRATDALDNWPYMLVLTLLCTLYTFAVLALDRQKQFFNAR
jgi:hypothetical protein